MMQKFDKEVKKIAVFTSGGDAPGMNASIRAVVRMAIYHKLEVFGIVGGYSGFLNKEIVPLNLRSVANVIQRGGTFLKTGRSKEFLKAEYRAEAAQFIKDQNIDALVCIGGDGSFTGANVLWNEHQIPIVGVPGTIDNDITGTDYTIGFDTAVNTALEAIDKIRDTAASHDRLFIVEVMGRNSGFIAVDVGLSCGAEEIFVPEYPANVDRAIQKIQDGARKGKTSSILIAAEGQKPGRAYDLADAIRKKANLDAKVCILGHIQRGGAPTSSDRMLATRLGAAAVQKLLEKKCNIMVGVEKGNIVEVPFDIAIQKEKKCSLELIKLAQILAN